jgi:16S rRNA (guanine527-N7)-methyltransferase
LESAFKKKVVAPPPPKEHWRLMEWFKDLTPEQNVLLKKYNDQLSKFNNALNLISPKTLAFADVIHFSDCIFACRIIYKDAKPTEIYDIGSGNGFPGLIFAILYPDVKVILLDRDVKKIDFLKQVASELLLKNVVCRAEGIDSIPQGSLSCVMTRGFAPIPKAILAFRKSFKRGGSLYMLKSEEWASEIANIPSQLCSFWLPSLVSNYRLPLGEVEYSIIKLSKTAD